MPSKVLIIDDDVMIGAALAIRLRAAGCEIVTAANGTAGLEAAAEHRPDVILLDIRMPDIDGFEVNRRLKATPDLAAIPVVFLSANVQESARQQAMLGGAAGFHSKPYDAAEVLATIERVCVARTSVLGEQQ